MNEAAASNKLWMIQATVVASPECGYPPGETRALLVFVTAPERTAALKTMYQGVIENGWHGAIVLRSGEISSDTDIDRDGGLRSAARFAVEGGVGIVVYAEPVADPADPD